MNIADSKSYLRVPEECVDALLTHTVLGCLLDTLSRCNYRANDVNDEQEKSLVVTYSQQTKDR